MNRKWVSISACVALLMASWSAAAAAQDNVAIDKVEWNRRLAAQFETGIRTAIVIGVEGPDLSKIGMTIKREQGPAPKACANNAELFATLLTENLGYPQDQVLLMTPAGADDMQPRQENVARVLKARLDACKPDDIILVYFSGMTVEQAALCLSDFPANFNGEREKADASMLRLDGLRGLLHQCPARRKLLLIDCCHGGRADQFTHAWHSVALGTEFQQTTGLLTLVAGAPEETPKSYGGYGLFTKSVARGLAGSADFDRNGIVDSDELYRYLLTDVSSAIARLDATLTQTPTRVLGQDVVGVFALSRPTGTRLPLLKEPRRPKPGETWTNSLGMKFAYVSSTAATPIGSPEEEPAHEADEYLHEVALTKQLYYGVYEVTQSEYRKVMDAEPSFFCAAGAGRDKVSGLDTGNFPV
ncbi:MAG: caspase family protein, partial [Planctomycetia bacterium]|nr:caspase family protein [Planctomycetia bacterium]